MMSEQKECFPMGMTLRHLGDDVQMVIEMLEQKEYDLARLTMELVKVNVELVRKHTTVDDE